MPGTLPHSRPGAPAGTRERILAAATAQVRRRGLRRVTMDDVAREAGVSRRTVYVHFADRDDLIHGVLARNAAGHVAAIAPHIRAHATLAAQAGEAAVRVHARSPQAYALGLAERDGESEDAAVRLLRGLAFDAWLHFWSPLVEHARERGEVRADLDTAQATEWIVRAVISLVLVPARSFDPDDPEQVRRFVADHITRGLC